MRTHHYNGKVGSAPTCARVPASVATKTTEWREVTCAWCLSKRPDLEMVLGPVSKSHVAPKSFKKRPAKESYESSLRNFELTDEERSKCARMARVMFESPPSRKVAGGYVFGGVVASLLAGVELDEVVAAVRREWFWAIALMKGEAVDPEQSTCDCHDEAERQP